MSIYWMNRVWTESKMSEGALLVLLSIADHAGDDGTAYPSIRRLAHRSRLSDRGVQYALTKIQASGELEIDINGGPRGANLYRIKLTEGGANIAPVKPISPVKLASGTPEAQFTGGVKLVAPEPSLNHQEPSLPPISPNGIPKVEELVTAWNRVGTVRPVLRLSANRKRHGQMRLREEPDLTRWQNAISRVSKSKFLTGDNDRGWIATFDWLIRPDTLTKIEEGVYDAPGTHLSAHPGPTRAEILASVYAKDADSPKVPGDEGR